MSIHFINTPFKKIKIGYTDSTKGFSRGEFKNFNLSTVVGDDCKNVMRNRHLLQSYINADAKWLNQSHTNVSYNFDDYDQQECDAIYTSKPKQLCSVLTADCLPILLFDKSETKVAAIHAGWKGLASGIIESTLKNFIGMEIVVWFGPCITMKHFEVGTDVYDMFVSQKEDYKNAFVAVNDGKYLFDIKYVATKIIEAHNSCEVVDSKLCTYSNKKFYSYRRNNITGRQVSFIWIE